MVEDGLVSTQTNQRAVDLDHVASELAEAGTPIAELLRSMVDVDASDLHLKVGSPVGFRINGLITPQGEVPLEPTETRAFAEMLLTTDQLVKFDAEGDLDLSYTIPGVSRYRVNVFTQRGTVGLVIRRIPNEVPPMHELGLPPSCKDLADKPRGLILVTGPTGSGKSTTLAALIDYINTSRRGHILTMEDPIEFLHEDKSCWVSQREIGADAISFKAALRRAMRQDPDVIMVGEMRDLETISLAVTAAETGHLVFGTLHTTSAVQTISRIVDVFPPDQQQQIRMQLADTIQGIISQTLLPRANGQGRIAAHEILVGSDAIRALIRDAKPSQIRNIMQTSAREGMQTLEMSLNGLLGPGLITHEAAVAKANYPSQIR